MRTVDNSKKTTEEYERYIKSQFTYKVTSRVCRNKDSKRFGFTHQWLRTPGTVKPEMLADE